MSDQAPAIAVVPARGGSKGIPRKNLALVGGRSLLAWTAHTIRDASELERVVVSTDDEEIVDHAKGLGLEVIIRPAALARDDARTEESLLHVADTLGLDDRAIIVTLEPTTPFRRAATVDRGVRLAREPGVTAVVSVIEAHAVVGSVEGGRFTPLPQCAPRRRQERTPLFQECGVLYATQLEALRRTGSVFGDGAHALVVEPIECLDINEPTDLELADVMASAILHEGGATT